MERNHVHRLLSCQAPQRIRGLSRPLRCYPNPRGPIPTAPPRGYPNRYLYDDGDGNDGDDVPPRGYPNRYLYDDGDGDDDDVDDGDDVHDELAGAGKV